MLPKERSSKPIWVHECYWSMSKVGLWMVALFLSHCIPWTMVSFLSSLLLFLRTECAVLVLQLFLPVACFTGLNICDLPHSMVVGFPPPFWRKSPELITLLWSFATSLQNALHLSLLAALMSLQICKVSQFVIGWKHECLPFRFNWHFVLVLLANVIAITQQPCDKEN